MLPRDYKKINKFRAYALSETALVPAGLVKYNEFFIHLNIPEVYRT